VAPHTPPAPRPGGRGGRPLWWGGPPPLVRSGELGDIWLKAKSRQFNEKLRRFFTLGSARTWGMKTGTAGLLSMIVVAGATVWLVTRIALGLPLVFAIPLTGVVAFLMPRAILLRQQKEVESQFTDLFPDAVVAISRMLRAGLPITTAVRSISHEAPPPVNDVFTLIADQIEIGAPIEDALDASSRHIGLPDFRFFAVAVVLQHATGGNLAATLEILADIVRRRRAVRLKARATTAEIRVSAYVLGALPFLIVGTLLIIQPGYLAPLVTDPRGHVILGLAVGGLLLAGLTMRQMMRSVTTM
jgi:tight adherence protein B